MSSSPHATSSQALPVSHLLKPPREGWGSKISPNVSEEQAQDHLMKWHIHKSMWPAEVQPRILRELVDVDNPLSIIFKNSWQSGEVTDNWKKGEITSVFK